MTTRARSLILAAFLALIGAVAVFVPTHSTHMGPPLADGSAISHVDLG